MYLELNVSDLQNLRHVRTYGKTDELKGMEKYMQLACGSGTFTYLSLYVIQTRALVCSPGLIMDVGQMNDVIMLMRGGKKGSEVTLMEKTYRVDKAVKGDHLHAHEVQLRKDAKLDKSGPSTLWAAPVGDYVVLGIGPASEDANMEREISNLRGNMA